MRLDLVLPAYNEEHRIGRTLEAYVTRCDDPGFRFIVALDRCTDRTAEIVGEQMCKDSRVSLIEFPKLGKGGVIMEAFRACDAELVGFVDADCATPPAGFLQLVEAATKADGAIATRRHPATVLPAGRPLSRRVASRAFAWGVRALFGLPFRDTQCGAKVFRREVVDRALPLLSSRDLLFDVDLLVVARALGFRILEVPTIWIDRDGSRIRVGADGGKMAASALRLWLHHRILPVNADGEVEPAVETSVSSPAGETNGQRAAGELVEVGRHGAP